MIAVCWNAAFVIHSVARDESQQLGFSEALPGQLSLRLWKSM